MKAIMTIFKYLLIRSRKAVANTYREDCFMVFYGLLDIGFWE